MKIERTAKRTASSRRADNVQATNQITGRRRWFALAAVMLIMFFSSLDQTASGLTTGQTSTHSPHAVHSFSST